MKRGIFRRFIAAVATFVTVLAALWLLACIAASFISPVQIKYLALFSLTTPIALLVNLVFFILWLLFSSRKWRAWLPLLALVSAYQLIPAVFGLNFRTAQDFSSGPDRIKVLSWNVHGMGIFDRPVDRTTDDRIMELIRDESPDVLCLTEFYTLHNNALKPYATEIMRQGGYKEYRFRYDNTLGTKVYLGTAIFSKYPILNYQVHPLHTRTDGQDDVQLMQYDLRMEGGRKVRIFFTHLQSFLLSDGEKTYLEEVRNRDRELEVVESMPYLRRFGEAYVKRAIQADSASSLIEASPYPVILCGDFNDLPGSYTYQRMRRNLKDAFVEKGAALGRTYNRLSPTIRIDYIFYDPDSLELTGYKAIQTRLSDHYPIVATYRFKH